MRQATHNRKQPKDSRQAISLIVATVDIIQVAGDQAAVVVAAVAMVVQLQGQDIDRTTYKHPGIKL